LGAEALGERQVKLTWKEAHDEDSGIGGYIIYRDGEFVGGVAGEVSEYNDFNVRPSRTYEYSLKAMNGSGVEGPAAGPVSVTTWEDSHDPEFVSVNVLTSRSLNLFFSEEVTKESAQNVTNYTISDGIKVRRARLSDDLQSVRLTTDEHQQGMTYTITVSGILDLAGRSISSDANSLTYEMSSDFMWLFAEDAALTNGAALKFVDGTLGAQAAFCPQGMSSILFRINAKKEGTWYVWGRFMFIGSNNDPNSFFLTVDDGAQRKFGNNKDFFNVWHWDGDGNLENGPGTALNIGRLSAGEHKITLVCREPLGSPGTENILIDMLYLTMLGENTPSDEKAPTRTAINSNSESTLAEFTLRNFPNPFNPKTQIRFFLPQQSDVTIDVYDILGRKVDCIMPHKLLAPGIHTLVFDGSKLSSGIYLCSLETETEILLTKMMLLQ